MNQLVGIDTSTLPALVTAAGDDAEIRFLEFFAGQARNPNTRRAYRRAAGEFLSWCQYAGVSSIATLAAAPVATWIEAQTKQADIAAPMVKQQLAAIRHLFDWLLTGGLRDRAPIGTLLYALAMIRAAVRMKVDRAAMLMPEPLWMRSAKRAACSLTATTVKQGRTGYSVYVILLHNPARQDPWGLYVGQTSRDPDLRFDQHKSGYKASSAARRFGVRLLPELVEHLNPMRQWESLELEAALADAFRAVGISWVEGGH
jgi:hypothetical protein